ncbi:MAG: PKD domain-containing protein, partial [Phaeodactylibacter sp.]|nr:PKD domain-containing protein [Phaeodactylibacter sp.]
MKTNTTLQQLRSALLPLLCIGLFSGFATAQQITWIGVPCSGTGCPGSGRHTNSFIFDVSGLSLPETDYSYVWNFGDGTFKTIAAGVGASVEHTYNQPGTYTPIVELTQEEYDDDPPPASSL